MDLNRGRKAAEGGILVALFSIMLCIFFFVPLPGIILWFFMPAPFIIYTIKHTTGWAFGMLAVSCLIAVLLGLVVTGLPSVLITGGAGILIGWCIKKGKPFSYLFISTMFFNIAALVAMYGISVWLLGINYAAEFQQMLDESTKQSASILESFGQSLPEETEKQLENLPDQLMTVLPAILTISSGIMTILTLWAIKPILKRFSPGELLWPPFRNLRLPQSLLWYYVLVQLIMWMAKPETGTVLASVLLNLTVLLTCLILIQGYSFVFYWVRVKDWPKAVPYLVLAGSVMLSFIPSLVQILGIIDLGFPIRRIIGKK